MTTANATTRPTVADLREALEELLKLAVNVAVVEERLDLAARRPEWTEGHECLLDAVPTRFYDATRAEIESALRDARGEHGMSDWDGLQSAQSVQDALDVLNFATKRDEESVAEEGGH